MPIQASPGSRRLLLYFPIIHTAADLGALGGPVQQAKLNRMGRQGLRRNTQLIDRSWAEIEAAIERLSVPYERVRVYQDGLAQCGREAEIITELAAAGSRNHRLLVLLQQRGATIMGTEAPDLLVEEYALATQSVASGGTLGGALLDRRDRFIAGRVNGTLQPGETGMLFLGMLHSVAHLLDKDIRIQFPVSRPLPTGAVHK
jgi:hypothetical protein